MLKQARLTAGWFGAEPNSCLVRNQGFHASSNCALGPWHVLARLSWVTSSYVRAFRRKSLGFAADAVCYGFFNCKLLKPKGLQDWSLSEKLRNSTATVTIMTASSYRSRKTHTKFSSSSSPSIKDDTAPAA